MIIGIGTDLCDIRRIEKTLSRFGARFTARIYTDLECQKAEKCRYSSRRTALGGFIDFQNGQRAD